jgi:hypothetical protein
VADKFAARIRIAQSLQCGLIGANELLSRLIGVGCFEFIADFDSGIWDYLDPVLLHLVLSSGAEDLKGKIDV